MFPGNLEVSWKCIRLNVLQYIDFLGQCSNICQENIEKILPLLDIRDVVHLIVDRARFKLA